MAMDEKDKDTLKITNQFRAKGGMAYDLKCKGTRITLLVTPRTTPDDSIVVTGWGPTRMEALRAAGRSSTASSNLMMFDWDAVAAVLSSVRAV